MEGNIQLQSCDINRPNQLWKFKVYSQDYEDIISGTNEKFKHITEQIKHWKEKLIGAENSYSKDDRAQERVL